MFCHKCGHKLTNDNQCTNCGEIVRNPEMCGGFWGLVGTKPPVKPIDSVISPDSTHQQLERNDKQIRDGLNVLMDEQRRIKRKQERSNSITYALVSLGVLIIVVSNVLVMNRLGDIQRDNQMLMYGLRDDMMSLVDSIENETEEYTAVSENESTSFEITYSSEEASTQESVTEETVTEETVTEETVTEETVTEETNTEETITEETISETESSRNNVWKGDL